MFNGQNIIDDPAAYGRRGQTWSPEFVSYMVEIVTHPVYAGMPDATTDEGKIQWEAPSNRGSGRYQHTHHRRRDWWRDKARSLGIDPDADQWISTVAKRIHPTGYKPCKRCGRVLRIAYVYPNGHLQRRIRLAFGEDFEIDPLEPIVDIINRIADLLGVERLSAFREVLRSRDIVPPEGLDDVDSWVSWLEDDYIPSEPSLLSPGAMSNAPDRFDGFHSFNLCCRAKADTGRHNANLRSYTTDRRVFEYWSDGDWIAADRMMGLISSSMRSERCADGGDGPPTADHIGPLSLGFAHRPHFRLLSRGANSAKNNRMTLQDVTDLLAAEESGNSVVSWYAQPLWDMRKQDVATEELALRLSKQLRDNQRSAMKVLFRIYHAEHLTFLASLLGLEFAEYNIEFVNLRVDDYVPTYEQMRHIPRRTKYALEQKARRLRIGFEALRVYGEKLNRHDVVSRQMESAEIEDPLNSALGILETADEHLTRLNENLRTSLGELDTRTGESRLRAISNEIPRLYSVGSFVAAKSELAQVMTQVGQIISSMWESDRYVRTAYEEFTED